MSEYQYYEFQAIDRPLTPAEMGELRSVSKRARITPTSFVNEYSWGDFRGDPDLWMERYFDAFLYVANWGTHLVKLRLPVRLLAPSSARAYLGSDSDSASVAANSQHVVLSFLSNDEHGGWEDGEGQLSSLIAVRADLARGDRRSLYLGWLLRAQEGELDDDEVEPPLPAGLAQISASLDSLVDFLRIDRDLLHVAALASPPLPDLTVNRAQARAWVAGLPLEQKDELITRLLVDADHACVAEFLQRFLTERRIGESAAVVSTRTVAELLAAAEVYAERRKQLAAQRRAEEQARREQEEAAARDKHLAALAGQEARLWSEVESLVAMSKATAYEQAVRLLIDLRDIDARAPGGDFGQRLAALRHKSSRRSSLIIRLNDAGL